jgi:hypothetical protein
MKMLRPTLLAVLISLPQFALAQTPPSETQKAFAALRTLDGSWVGAINLPAGVAAPTIGDSMRINFRVTSRGNAIAHEMHGLRVAEDWTKNDHPLTMIYLDGDQLTLTHYCDAGNRPRMTAKVSADGKTIDFYFVDLAGSEKYWHMHHATFTFIDANHHSEEWTYMLPGGKAMSMRGDFKREAVVAASSAK